MVLILLNIFVLSGLLASSFSRDLLFPSRIPEDIHQESYMSGNGVRNWFNRQGLNTQPYQDPSTRGLSAEQLPKNAKPLLEQNGIDLNDPEGNNVIYL